jgi:hypothetical protein
MELVDKRGSISEAGRQMGRSHRRAWLLVDSVNRCYYALLVAGQRGGRGNRSGDRKAGRRVRPQWQTRFWIGDQGKFEEPVHSAIVAKDRATVTSSTGRRSPRAALTTALPDWPSLPLELLRCVCPRPRWAQRRGSLPYAGLKGRAEILRGCKNLPERKRDGEQDSVGLDRRQRQRHLVGAFPGSAKSR